MIFGLLLNLIVFIVAGITSWIPIVNELPFGIDSYLLSGFAYVHGLFDIFPPLEPVFYAFIFIMHYVAVMWVIRKLLRIFKK